MSKNILDDISDIEFNHFMLSMLYYAMGGTYNCAYADYLARREKMKIGHACELCLIKKKGPIAGAHHCVARVDMDTDESALCIFYELMEEWMARTKGGSDA